MAGNSATVRKVSKRAADLTGGLSAATPAILDSVARKSSKAVYLLVAVSDIRGFTSLTSRVDQFCQSTLNKRAEVLALTGAFLDYMSKTQLLARKAMTNELAATLGEDFRRWSVVKSTGDGFMVAVKLQPVDKPITDDDRVTWQARAVAMIRGLSALVDEAQPRTRAAEALADTFFAETSSFMKRWGKYLGLSFSDFEAGRTEQLRVAGAIAMGTGFFLAEPRKDLELEDAFGHAVNLAFRLCDKAGRVNTPYILLDRRVAKLLQDAEGGRAQVRYRYQVRTLAQILDLKGIEETWCLSCERPREKKLPPRK